MSFTKHGRTFDGPYFNTSTLDAKAGVYIVWDERSTDDLSHPLDVGESEDVRERLGNHDRADCWKRKATGTIKYSATYTSDLTAQQRRDLEKKIRDAEKPPCGDQ